MIVDSHVHAIAPNRERYPLAPAHGQSGVWPYVSTEEVLQGMDAAGVKRAVLHHVRSAYGPDNRYVADSVRQYPGRFTSVCVIDVLASNAPDQLSRWVEDQGMRGIRLFATGEGEHLLLDDARVYPVWQRARKLGIAVAVMMNSRDLARLRATAERFIDVPIALDHLANFNVAVAPSAAVAALIGLASLPNLYLKFSTDNIAAARAAGIPPADLFAPLIEAFGPSRLIWGSNFSTDQPTYVDSLALAKETLAALPEPQREQVLGGTALRLWFGG